MTSSSSPRGGHSLLLPLFFLLLLLPLDCLSRSLDSPRRGRREKKGFLGEKEENDSPIGSLDSLPFLSSDREKAEEVKKAMKVAWDSYVRYAWGADELNPTAKRGSNGFGGMGCTIIDSLSTLKIMGMDDEFYQGVDWVAKNLHFGSLGWVSLFETNIRHLGGLLSAYGLSKEPVLLEKAKDLGNRFLPAFHPVSGLPVNDINLKTGEIRQRHNVHLAEVGTIQLEMLYLSYLTKDPKYAIPALKVLRTIDGGHTSINNGMGSQTLDRETGAYRHDRWTLGAMADSYYEYLIKLHVFTGSDTATGFRRMWDEMAVKMRQYSVQTRGNSVFVGEIHGGVANHVMDHLACFSGGMFALAGAASGGKQEDIAIGEGITKTCVKAYDETATGLAPEVFSIDSSGSTTSRVSHNLLRPETVESLYVVYRITGHEDLRDAGWRIFRAFETNCHVPGSGYSGIQNVNRNPASYDGKQQSFFMAETLKYLYLLFSSSSTIPLNKYVFNTEAHPLPIPADRDAWSFLSCSFPDSPSDCPPVSGTSSSSFGGLLEGRTGRTRRGRL